MPDAVVPRWEWRTFGDRFDAAERNLGARQTTRVEDSDELYLLSANSNASTKLRDGIMDMKRLERVSDDGLELWRPVLKADFPIAADEVGALYDGLDVTVPALTRTEYSLAELRAT